MLNGEIDIKQLIEQANDNLIRTQLILSTLRDTIRGLQKENCKLKQKKDNENQDE